MPVNDDIDCTKLCEITGLTFHQVVGRRRAGKIPFRKVGKAVIYSRKWAEDFAKAAK